MGTAVRVGSTQEQAPLGSATSGRCYARVGATEWGLNVTQKWIGQEARRYNSLH
ncbi:hypothetical protein WCLP8_2690006 [uncultured Gammaproteobacteria bacterium]